jgi:hypothetical protein
MQLDRDLRVPDKSHAYVVINMDPRIEDQAFGSFLRKYK